MDASVRIRTASDRNPGEAEHADIRAPSPTLTDATTRTRSQSRSAMNASDSREVLRNLWKAMPWFALWNG
jgi:hypothetical protein